MTEENKVATAAELDELIQWHVDQIIAQDDVNAQTADALRSIAALRQERDEAQKWLEDLQRVSNATPDEFALELPDGGDVKVWEAVERMAVEIEKLRKRRIMYSPDAKAMSDRVERLEASCAKKDAALREIVDTGSDGTHTGDLHAQCCEIAEAALAPAAQGETRHLTTDEQRMLGKALRASTTFVRNVEPAPSAGEMVLVPRELVENLLDHYLNCYDGNKDRIALDVEAALAAAPTTRSRHDH